MLGLLITHIKFLYIFKDLQAMSNDRLLMLAPKVGSGIELFFEILGKVYLFAWLDPFDSIFAYFWFKQ